MSSSTKHRNISKSPNKSSNNTNKSDNSSLKIHSQHSRKSNPTSPTKASETDEKYTYRFAILITCLIAITACFLYLFSPTSTRLFSNDRLKQPSIRAAHPEYAKDNNNNKNNAKNSQTSQEEDISWRDHNCSVLMKSAMLLTERGSQWHEMALDFLAACALQEENNHLARWNMGLLLSRMGRFEEAEVWFEEASKLSPTNTAYLKGIADFYMRHNQFSKTEKYLESYLKIKGGMQSWDVVMTELYMIRDDEKSFLLDVFDPEELMNILTQLISCYLHLGSLNKVDYSYDILSSLFPDDKFVHLRYSLFSFGIGHFLRGVTELQRHTLVQIMTDAQDDNIDSNEAYQLIGEKSLSLVTSGMNSHMLSMTRIYSYQSQSSLQMINAACQLSDNLYRQLNTLPVQLEVIRNVFEKCFIQHNLLDVFLKQGTQFHSENQFGWTPLLQFCSLGSVSIVSNLADNGAALSTINVLEQNCLHIALIYGNIKLVKYLVSQKNFNISQIDLFGRTAGDYACQHGWSANEFYSSLKLPIPPDCQIKPLTVPRVQSSAGGWLGSPTNLPTYLISSKCDIDVVRNTISTDDFFLNYLSIQKPVLIRNMLTTEQSKLKLNFQRLTLARKYGMLQFPRSPNPHAKSFGSFTVTLLREFLESMSKFNLDMNEVNFNDITPPDYIFQSIPQDSLLIEDFKLPNLFQPDETNIIPRQMQFYVGPALSGSPPHFHSHSWNLLIYGRKRWFLYPPHRSFYSKDHVLDWYRNSAPLSDVIACTQEQGDIMYVPDMWGHAFINLREGVGLTQEFDHGLTEFSI